MKKTKYIIVSFIFVLTILPMQTVFAANPGSLIKLSCQSNAGLDDSCRSVYYLASDNKRYVFPNPKTFATWYDNFSDVLEVSSSELSSYQIGGNATYRPGVKLAKITTDPKVYAIDQNASLRWVTTAAIAETLYGSDWASQVDDIPDAFFVNYQLGADINQAVEFDRSQITANVPNINTELGFVSDPPPDPAPQDDPVSQLLQTVNGFTVSQITGNSAEITWETGLAMTSTMFVGTTTSVSDFTISEEGLAQTHIANLTGLQPSTTYYYRVNAQSDDGQSFVSNTMTFDTEFQTEGVTIANWQRFILTQDLEEVSSPAISGQSNLFGIAWLGKSAGNTGFDVYFSRANLAGDQADINQVTNNQKVLEVAIATDGVNYLASWVEVGDNDTNMIKTAQLDAKGNVIAGPTTVVSDSFIQGPESLNVAYNGSNYGLSWSAHNSSTSNSEIYFVLVDSSGSAVKEVFQVTGSNDDNLLPDMTWNRNSFGLIWQRKTSSDADIYYHLLDSNGSPSLIPNETKLNDSTNQLPGQPSISGSYLNEYVFSYFDFHTGSQFFRQDIFWKSLNDAGKILIDNIRLTEYDQSLDGFEPQITWQNGISTIIWQRDNNRIYITSIDDSRVYHRDRVLLATGTDITQLDSIRAGDAIGVVWVEGAGSSSTLNYIIGQ